MISVFTYSDYRTFLKEFYSDKKKSNRRFSYRLFCSLAGIKSPGHLMLILKSKANISARLAAQFCQALDLNKRQSEYFVSLVAYNQAQTHDAKKKAFEKMIAFRESSVSMVAADQYEYYRAWYHAPIRALLEIVSIKDEYDILAKMVVPPISRAQARRSIARMLKLGLLQRDSNGFLRPAEANIDTGVQGSSTAIIDYGLSTIDLARRAIREMPAEARKFSWVTLGISAKGYGELLDKIRAFRADAAAIAAADTAEQVYQVNIQLFPMSKPQAKQGGES
jgi:uncharacterized protein (TIGR02147 family)